MAAHSAQRVPANPPRRTAGVPGGTMDPRRQAPLEAPAQPAGLDRRLPGSLHVSKLRGISREARRKLKRQGIAYADQLLAQAGRAAERRRLATRTGIAEAELLRLVRRADLARIKGVGAIFADLLELIGVRDVAALAARDPGALHSRLHQLNTAERFARRAPTPDEVADWIRQARSATALLDGA